MVQSLLPRSITFFSTTPWLQLLYCIMRTESIYFAPKLTLETVYRNNSHQWNGKCKSHISLYSRCKRLKWGSMWDCKWGQVGPRPPRARRYTFTGWHGSLWLSLCRRVGTKKGRIARGRRVVGEVGRGGVKRKDSSLQVGKKGQLVTKSPVQASLPRGGGTSVIRFLLTISLNLANQAQNAVRGQRDKRTMAGVYQAAHRLTLSPFN